MTQITLRSYGERGYRVRVYVARGRVWCGWRAQGRARVRSWLDSPQNRLEARQWAQAYVAERLAILKGQRQRSAGPITLSALYDRYRRANAEAWRPKTTKVYGEFWGQVAAYFGREREVLTIGLDDLDGFREAQRARHLAHGQVRRQIGFLRQIVNFGEARELIPRNRLRAYRYVIPKDERSEAPGEYTRAELLAIAAELAAPRHWRPRGVVTLCGSLGARVNAVLHLTWADVDLDGGTVTWRAAFDKLGEERVQPLTPRAQAALIEAHQHRHESEPWVFHAVRAKGRPFHYNSVHHHLRAAEERAGVRHLPQRAFHGLRRMVTGDVMKGADLQAAAAWIGDRSVRIVAGSYLKRRAEDVEAARAAIAAREA